MSSHSIKSARVRFRSNLIAPASPDEQCRECRGAGCRQCAWMGTEEARLCFERAHRIVSEQRRRRIGEAEVELDAR